MPVRRIALVLILMLAPLSAQEPTSRPANRLAKEKSPYLLQHAHNPVDWWPWCDEAFAEAKRRGVPVFLSIGYSTCHWCHVMRRESFEDEEVAAALNAAFVCVKLDREERPDVDAVYMKVVQSLHGRGGWPATILLLPDRSPFWAATYLPRETTLNLATEVRKQWQADPARIEKIAAELLAYLKRMQLRPVAEDLPPRVLEDRAVADLVASFDETGGGFGGAPKFPRVPTLLFLLRAADERAPGMVRKTLEGMAHGGIHDHLGGGLHRYAIDVGWRVPHFEKMLYDQAQALQVAVELGQTCDEPRALEMAADIATCLLRDFRAPGGGFYAAFDADTDHVEGATYVWMKTEIEEALSGDELKVVLDRFDIRAEGNQDELQGLEQANVLIVAHPFAESAERLGMTTETLMAHWRSARAKLFAIRSMRPQPHRDDKIITAWNGLTIGALARAGRALGRPDLVGAAREAADFVDRELRDEEGRLLRRFVAGEAAHPATLEDHAYLAQGLLDLFEATGDRRALERALREAEAIRRFHDEGSGAFFDSLATDDLVIRTSEAFDGAQPSGNGIATLVMLRVHALTGESTWIELADSALRVFGAEMAAYPSGFPTLQRALKARHEGSIQIVLIGAPERADFRELGTALRRRFLGDAILLTLSPALAKELEDILPLVAGKAAGPDGAPLVYVCRDRVCAAPVPTLAQVEELLAESGGSEDDR